MLVGKSHSQLLCQYLDTSALVLYLRNCSLVQVTAYIYNSVSTVVCLHIDFMHASEVNSRQQLVE